MPILECVLWINGCLAPVDFKDPRYGKLFYVLKWHPGIEISIKGLGIWYPLRKLSLLVFMVPYYNVHKWF